MNHLYWNVYHLSHMVQYMLSNTYSAIVEICLFFHSKLMLRAAPSINEGKIIPTKKFDWPAKSP